ncbi:MAG: hypothetical protein K0S33_1939 [Bacteroidetes bacterium]|jgi:hypothetical protein|nr:hypothetical protein [Bacteroidota bacterium]
MKISPDLIPHSLFHTGSWLQSANHPDWYYFSKKKSSNSILNKDFSKSVDEPLQELVHFLQGKGIKTTPSCAGHHIRSKDFKTIYEELEKDRKAIRNGGLQIKDIESGKVYLYRDKKYELPWEEKEFIEKAGLYQQNGVLGLRPGNRKRLKAALLKLDIPGVEVVEKKPTLLILTSPLGTDADIKETWKEITRQVKAIVENTPLA